MTEQQIKDALRLHAPFMSRTNNLATVSVEIVNISPDAEIQPESNLLVFIDDALRLKLPAMTLLQLSEMLQESLLKSGLTMEMAMLSAPSYQVEPCPIAQVSGKSCKHCSEKDIGYYMKAKIQFGSYLTFSKSHELLNEYLGLLRRHEIDPSPDMPFIRLMAASLAFMCGIADVQAVKAAWKEMRTYVAE
jgi:hypothetical protein